MRGLAWSKLGSLRFLAACFFGAGIPAVLLAKVWHPLSYTFYVFFLVLVYTGLKFGPVLECPRCGKNLRVARGATRCHHCGFDVEPSGSVGAP